MDYNVKPMIHRFQQNGMNIVMDVNSGIVHVVDDVTYKVLAYYNGTNRGMVLANLAKDYEEGGASAISVLTEPYWFQGRYSYLQEIRQAVSIPIIRKDFVVDEYMIYEAKLMGADAVLLICAILNDQELKRFFQIADSLGLTALVEAHDQEEVDRALKAGARLIGVNNRDLHTFTVDINNSIRYRQSVPENVLFVSESGIRTKEDIRRLMDNNVNGVLIGETMMRALDRVAAVREFIGYSR